MSEAEAPGVGSSLIPDQYGVRQSTSEIAVVDLDDLQAVSNF
jgi:hypothetical protein